MENMECKECSTDSIVYRLTCSGCRTRLALSEPCKIVRKYIVEHIEKQWGHVADWKANPNCGCDKVCERLKNVQKQTIPREDERTALRGMRRR